MKKLYKVITKDDPLRDESEARDELAESMAEMNNDELDSEGNGATPEEFRKSKMKALRGIDEWATRAGDCLPEGDE